MRCTSRIQILEYSSSTAVATGQIRRERSAARALFFLQLVKKQNRGVTAVFALLVLEYYLNLVLE